MQQVLSREDACLVEGLRAGDEAAFAALMRMYGAGMLWVAQMFVPSRAVAEEVVQEAWLGVLKGIDRFEGRSSVKTWLFRIVANTAKTRGVREARSVPFSSLGDDEDAVTVSPERFLGDGDRFPGHWAVPPGSWAGRARGAPARSGDDGRHPSRNRAASAVATRGPHTSRHRRLERGRSL